MKKILLTLTLLFPSISFAVDVATIIKYCSAVVTPVNELTQDQQMGLMYCYGLIEGIRTISIVKDDNPEITNICFPAKGSDNSDYARVVASALMARPELLKIEAGGASAAMMALKHAYPCR